MQTKVHSVVALRKAFTSTPENIKGIFTGVMDFLKMVKDETPGHLKNAAKIIVVIWEERGKLAKKKALGLDAGLNKTEYVAKYLGVKPNRRMLQIADAFAHVSEEVFDERELWMLQRLGSLAERQGKETLKQALRDAKIAIAKNDGKLLTEICARVVPCSENEKMFEYLTPEQFKAYTANTQKADSVSRARVLPLDHLLSVGVAEVIANEKMDAKTAANAETHVLRLLEELRKKQGKPTTADLQSLKALENKTAA